MIKLSTKGRYSTRFLLELALNDKKGPMLLKEIARNQAISVGYLEQFIPALKAANLINSSRGAHGGYSLAKNPSQINIKEIIQAVEGPLFLAECIKTPEVCNRVDYCVTRDLWEEVSQSLEKNLESRTLQDLVEKHKNKGKSRPLMYSI